MWKKCCFVLSVFFFYSVGLTNDLAIGDAGSSLLLKKLFSEMDSFVVAVGEKLNDPGRFVSGILDMHLLLDYDMKNDGVSFKKPLFSLLEKAKRSVQSASFAQYRDNLQELQVAHENFVRRRKSFAGARVFPEFKIFMENIDQELSREETFVKGLADLYLVLEHDAMSGSGEESRKARSVFLSKVKDANKLASFYKVDADYIKEILEKARYMTKNGIPVWPLSEGSTMFRLQDILGKVSTAENITVSDGLIEKDVEMRGIMSREPGGKEANPEDLESFGEFEASSALSFEASKKITEKKASSKRKPALGARAEKKKKKLSGTRDSLSSQLETELGKVVHVRASAKKKPVATLKPEVEKEEVVQESAGSGRKKKKVAGGSKPIVKPSAILSSAQEPLIKIKRKKREKAEPKAAKPIAPKVISGNQVYGAKRS